MSPQKDSKTDILNNLKGHVDSADLIFVVSGDASNIPVVDEPAKRCKTKCPGRKFNRNLQGQIVDASQFAVTCAEAQCPKKTASDGASIVTSVVKTEKDAKSVGKTMEAKHKRLNGPSGSNRSRMRGRGPTAGDGKWKREVILRQMKNHRISSTSMDQKCRKKLT